MAASTQPSLDEQTLAADYGWSYSMLQHSPELKQLFHQAVLGTWTAPKFVAKLRNTQWYRTQSESTRQMLVLQQTDPTEWKSRTNQMRLHLKNVYTAQTGHAPPSAWLTEKSSEALMLGWTDEQVTGQARNAVNYSLQIKRQTLGGEAGVMEDNVRKYARSMGVNVSNDWIGSQITNAMHGQQDESGILDSVKKMAMSTYRAFGTDIQAGATMADIAAPYQQMMAKELEISPSSIALTDNKINQALTATNKDGKPEPKQLWQFQQDLRNDPRWNLTQGAQDQTMSTARSVLSQMGLTA